MRKAASRVIVAALLAVALGAAAGPLAAQAAEASRRVYVAKVDGTIEDGLARYVGRVFDIAEREKAAAVMVEVSTPGGRVDSAISIKDRIAASPLRTIAYVRGHAWSAGALVTLAAEKIAMAPGSSIGSAEPRPLDEKVLSAWRAELESTAESRRRDPRLAAGMADAAMEIPGVKEKGKLLNLTAKQALEMGMCDAIAAGREEALQAFGLGGAEIVEPARTTAEELARFVSHPFVAPALLAAGFLGIALEAAMPGFGIPGIVGLSAFALYFGGQAAAGAQGWEVAALFLLGTVLLAIEAFIPGFGVFGFSGVACMALSIYFAIARTGQGVQALLIAVAASAVGILAMVRLGLMRGVWKKLTLSSTLGGTSARGEKRGSLVGKTGITLTELRPAGVVEIDGRRVDCLTSGEFIERGRTVRVVEDSAGTVVVKSAGGSADATPGTGGPENGRAKEAGN